jgi:MFS family permease
MIHSKKPPHMLLSPFAAVLCAIAAGGLGFGVVLPVSSVVLEGLHVITPLIGLMATIMFAGIALGAPLVGRCIELYGLRVTLTGGLLGAALTMLALSTTTALPAWFVIRFAMGVSFAAIFTSCETVINRISTEKNRGRNLGLYAFAFSLALMAGPVGLWLLQFGAWAPFLATGMVCLLVALLAYGAIPSFQEKAPTISFTRAFLLKLRVSLTAMVLAGLAEGALLALIPLFALREGFTPLETGILLFAFMLGHGGLTPLIGMAGDRMGLRRVLLLTYILGCVCFSALFFLPTSMALFVWLVWLLLGGAAVGALYPLGVGLLGEILPSDELPRGNAMTTFCYGSGSVVGPFIPALVMHVAAPRSLFVLVAVLYIAALILFSCERSAPPSGQNG